MEDLKLLVDLHIRHERQGPGSENETLKALELTGLSQQSALKVADIGCGTGASTLLLAEKLDAQITAIDLFPEFLEALESRAKDKNLQGKITTKAAFMDSLPFKDGELDLIWSEGAIYNMGFKKGIKEWRKFLKPSGVLAVSEITWITDSRPKEIEDFWTSEYPEIATASEKIKILEEAGYKTLGHFNLPVSCWSENYYAPLKESFSTFISEQSNSEEAKKLVEFEKQEIALYEKYKEYYSYGFYIATKI
jgi:ubiquinone/menaquinone biosynthesis C-methylase UbiE